MVCTYCGSATQVFNSRHQKRANNVWRRRRCQNSACGAVFSTIEQVDYEKSWVVQYQTGNREAFVRDRLAISIFKSLQHRSTALTDAVGLTQTIMNTLQSFAQNEVMTTTAIATVVYEVLSRFDKPAATMYQAYHSDVL